MHRRFWLTICLAAAGCALRSSLPELGDVPAFTLTAQDGTAVTRDSLKGKVWVVDFIFTTCQGPCPRLSAQMHRLQQRLLVNGAANLIEHSTKFVLVDRKARIRGYYESLDASTLDQLIGDIGPLRKEIF